MIESLMPYAGTLAIFAVAWFVLNGYYQEYKRSDNKVKTLATILPGTLLVGIPILGIGILGVFWRKLGEYHATTSFKSNQWQYPKKFGV